MVLEACRAVEKTENAGFTDLPPDICTCPTPGQRRLWKAGIPIIYYYFQ
jgi:hypothetical protein